MFFLPTTDLKVDDVVLWASPFLCCPHWVGTIRPECLYIRNIKTCEGKSPGNLLSTFMLPTGFIYYFSSISNNICIFIFSSGSNQRGSGKKISKPSSCSNKFFFWVNCAEGYCHWFLLMLEGHVVRPEQKMHHRLLLKFHSSCHPWCGILRWP